jgi:hypothetical protein
MEIFIPLGCQSFDVQIRETKERTFRMVNLGQKRTHLKINIHKVLCRKCDRKNWLELPFVLGKLPMTKSFIRYIIQLTSVSTLLFCCAFLRAAMENGEKYR